MARTRYLSALLFALLLPYSAQCGAWLQPEGHGQLIVTALHYRTDSFTDANGQPQIRDPFSKTELNPYLEYGLADWLTVGASLLLDNASSSINPFGERENYYAGEAELFVRLPLWRNEKRIVSLQALAKPPTLYGDEDLTQSQSGASSDAELTLLYGESFTWLGFNHFTDNSVGYRARTGGPEDQLRIAATFGTHLDENWTVLAQSFTTVALEIPQGAALTQQAEDDYDLMKLQLSVLYRLNEEWSVQLGGFRHVYTRNTGGDGGMFTALWRNF